MPETTASSRKNPDRFFRRREPLRRLLWDVPTDTVITAPKEQFAMQFHDIEYSLRALPWRRSR